jgi:apolipoprotein N-acyltransferase
MVRTKKVDDERPCSRLRGDFREIGENSPIILDPRPCERLFYPLVNEQTEPGPASGRPGLAVSEVDVGSRFSSRSNAKPREGSVLLHLPALVVGAYLMALSVGSHGHAWIGLLTLLPLLRAIQVLRPSQAAVCGGVWGLSLYVFTVGVVETTVAAGAQSLLLLTVVPAAYGWLGAMVTRRVGFSPLILGFGWVLVEFALQPVALQQGLLAGTQSDMLLVGAIGRMFGYVVVAFLVAFVSAWFLAVVTKIRFRIARPLFVLGLDDVGRTLWHLIPSRTPRLVPCTSHPRAPPVA